jgi:hypothetical protein
MTQAISWWLLAMEALVSSHACVCFVKDKVALGEDFL